MRPATTLIAGLLSVTLLAAGCGDDDPEVQTGDGTASAPDRAADLRGTITSVTPFVAVTDDCVPAEDLDPDGSVSNDDPPICTPDDNDVLGTILVEEDPAAPQGGRKISYTVTLDSAITGTNGDGRTVGAFGDLAVGQTADTWVAGGMCAESYPEQCGLEAIRVTG